MMNVAATPYDFAPAAPLFVVDANQPTPAGTFVSELVESLAAAFALGAEERELATLLMFGRPLGAIAHKLGVSISTAQQRCRELLATTATDGRQQLFELGLRLAAMRKLNSLFMSPVERRVA